MKNELLNFSNISNALTSMASHLSSGIKVAKQSIKSISPHIHLAASVVVEHVSKKADYAPDVKILFEKGVSPKEIAKILGISTSYVYKLLKKN